MPDKEIRFDIKSRSFQHRTESGLGGTYDDADGDAGRRIGTVKITPDRCLLRRFFGRPSITGSQTGSSDLQDHRFLRIQNLESDVQNLSCCSWICCCCCRRHASTKSGLLPLVGCSTGRYEMADKSAVIECLTWKPANGRYTIRLFAANTDFERISGKTGLRISGSNGSGVFVTSPMAFPSVWTHGYWIVSSRFDASKSTKGASKLRRDLINAEISNLRDLLPLPPSTRQRLSQLQLMALVCVYVRKANYFQQVFKRHESGHHHVPTPNIGFSKALNGFLMMMTQNGKLLYISDNAAEYLGHSMEDLLIHGDSVYDIIDKQDHQAIQTELVRNSTSPSDDNRMFLCRMNVSRNARRQMRFGDQKVVLVQGHYLSFLPLCSRNEPVFLATCTPVAMPETRECVVQGATNVFTSIHSMDMKFIHIDKNGEFHLGFPRSELQGASWYQLLHWECMREAQSKHRLITQSEQDRSCILLLRLQKRSGDWLWIHCVLQVKDNMENSQQPVIVCTNQVLSDREAAVMLTNSWLYHYYMVQSKLQYGLAYEAAAASRMAAAAAYYHPHGQHPQAMSPYSHHISHQHLDTPHHTYLQHQISPSIQHLHGHNGSTPSHHQMHLSPNENNTSSPGYGISHDSNFRYDRRLDPEPVPVDYSVHSHSELPDRQNVSDHYHQDHNQNHISNDEDKSPPVIQHTTSHTSHKRKSVKVESVKSENSPRVSPNSEVIVDLDRGSGGGNYVNGGGALMLATTPVPLHSFARPRVLIKAGIVDPAEFMEQWNPSPPWSDTTVQKVPDIIHQDLSPYVTTTPPTPTGTPSSLSVGSLSHQPPHSAFSFDWAPEQYVPSLQHPRAVPLADEEQTVSPVWPSEHRLFPLQPPPPPRILHPTPLLKMEHDSSDSPNRKESIRERSNEL